MEVSDVIHAPAALPVHGNSLLPSHCIGDWMGHKTGLDAAEKSVTLTGSRPLGLEWNQAHYYSGQFLALALNDGGR
jgi:hypothetical protein